MANAAYWFKHDSNAKDDYKCMLLIDQLGMEGYGIFWVLIETLREQDGYRYPMAMLPILAKRYGTSGEKMKAVVTSYDLFEMFEDGSFSSPALIRRMDEYDVLIDAKKKAGAIGGKKRAANAEAKRLLDQSLDNPQAPLKQCYSDAQAEPEQSQSSDIAEPEQSLNDAQAPLKQVQANRRELIREELIRDDETRREGSVRGGIEGRADQEVYRKVRSHSVSVGVVRSFLKDGYTQSEFDDVLDALELYPGIDEVRSISGLISSWLKKRKDKPRRTPGSKNHDPRYRLYTHSEVDKGQMWKDVSIVRIEGLSA